ncbi:MAG: PaaI family thioesterase [Marinosulfonomonas sp.]|nr:PaaI family thioesterase [Marinosulfonomonas sp.]
MRAPKAKITPDDLIDPAQLLTMSGLEFMQGVHDGTLSGPPIAQSMGFWTDEVEDGRIVMRAVAEFSHCNPTGAVHGGWYGTLLDSCMACAVMTKVPKGSFYTTLEYKVNITRSVPLGTEVVATGIVQHAGRTTGVANGELRGATDGRLYATGSTTCIIMKIE